MTALDPTIVSDDGGPTPPTRPPGFRRWLRTAVAVLAAVLLAVVVARFVVGRLQPHLYAGTVLQRDAPAPSLEELQFASGEQVDLAAFDGEAVLLFFGYTNCPDVCPMTLSTVARALEELDADERDRTNMVMVSVDPDRDDLASLQQYVGFFDPTFRGAGGTQDAIDRAATLYGIYYFADTAADDENYLVDHTASLMGIGPDGSLRIIWSSGVTAEDLAADIDELLS
ncbi:MAG: SCO family protein [Acidimicrobiales bacterium]